MKTKTRTTVSLGQGDHELLLKIAEKNGWPVGKAASLAVHALEALVNNRGAFAAQHEADEAITVAVRALEALMDAHQEYADQHDDDIGELYMRLAAEMPAGFVEVPKDGIRVGRAGDLPVVRVDNWFVFPDRETGDLLAEEQGGEGRIARIVDGEIKPLKMPSPGEVALN